jgi:hypothetical protein
MLDKLPIWTRAHVLWIAICESWKIAVVATLPLSARQEYVRQHVSENLKQPTLAVAHDLSAGRKSYELVHAIIDAAIEAKVPEFLSSRTA